MLEKLFNVNEFVSPVTILIFAWLKPHMPANLKVVISNTSCIVSTGSIFKWCNRLILDSCFACCKFLTLGNCLCLNLSIFFKQRKYSCFEF